MPQEKGSRSGKPFAARSNASPAVATDRPTRKIGTSLRLPIALNDDVIESMERDGYSPKKKSAWIEESLFAMARLDPDLSESIVGDKAQGANEKQVVVALSMAARRELKDLIIRLRLQMPTIEGVQSLVLRSAMRFRIRHPDVFPARE